MNKKIAFVFPGQGAQYVGMGSELAREYELVAGYFEKADAALGFAISKLCWQGPAEELTLTENAQPAILTMSCAAAFLVKQELGLEPAVAAGLSLGEYSALVTAGMLKFEDAVKLVARRGRYMQQAVPDGKGCMAAIFGLKNSKVEELCREAGGVADPANYNSPGQVVISGEREAVAAVIKSAKAAGARRAKELEVSAPFHSVFMQPAADRLSEELNLTSFYDPRFPVLSNVDASPVSVDNVRCLLARQVASPVLWQQSMENISAMGITTMIEAGPGKVLAGLARKIDSNLQVINIEKPNDLNVLKEAIKL